MIAGPLDRRVTLRRATVATNDLGEEVQTWCDLATVWAARAEVSNRERFAAQEVGAELVARFRVRYSQRVHDVSPLDRIVVGGVEHNITGVSMIGRNQGLEITAAARSDKG
jgi:SPP1 family predicted phage head-tail adaptor